MEFPLGDHLYITYSFAGRNRVGGSEKGNICFQNFIYFYQGRGRGCFKMSENVLTLYMDDYLAFLFIIFYQKYGNKDKVRMGRVSGMEISTK